MKPDAVTNDKPRFRMVQIHNLFKDDLVTPADPKPMCVKHGRWPCGPCGTSHYEGCECCAAKPDAVPSVQSLPPRADAPYRQCDECGRKSWAFKPTDPAGRCEMPQPGGLRCDGLLL